MVREKLESKKEEILRKLGEVGGGGLTKGKLGIKDGKSLSGQALKDLERERRVANLGTRSKTLYVLMELYKPLELACQQIERNARKSRPARSDVIELLSRKELEQGCLGQVRAKVDEAIDWLLNERKLLKLRRGRAAYFVHASQVKPLLVEGEGRWTEPGERPVSRAPLDRAAVLEAYRRIRDRLGYSNVHIFELHREVGSPMAEVKAFLVEESRKGNAVLSLGDWAVSSEEVRSGAIELYGKPHLLVRFRE